MQVLSPRGVFEYPYTQLKNKRVYYNTRVYPTNGLRERQRRIRQMLKGTKNNAQ